MSRLHHSNKEFDSADPQTRLVPASELETLLHADKLRGDKLKVDIVLVLNLGSIGTSPNVASNATTCLIGNAVWSDPKLHLRDSTKGENH